MPQEGADVPHEIECSTPAVAEPVTIVMPHANSDSNSVGELASETDYAGSSMPANPAVIHASVDNTAGSKLASPAVLHASEDNGADTARSKLASPVVLHGGEDNDPAGHKLDIQAMPHAGEDNNAGSELTFAAVPRAGDDAIAGSKMETPMPHVSVDDNAEFKIDGPAVLDAGEEKDNDSGCILAGEDNDAAGFRLSIQAMPHAGEDNIAGSKIATAAALQAGEGNNAASNLTTIQAAVPHAGEDDNNAGSKLASRAAMDDGDNDNNAAEEGMNGAVAGEEGGASVVAPDSSGGGAPFNASSKMSASDGGGILDAAAVEDDAPEAAAASRDRGRGRGGGKGKGKGVATAEEKAVHIWTEKERRKKMKTMFGTLHALLPQLPEKADKSTIVGEAVTYIKTLEGTVKNLETLKQERMRIRAQQLAAAAGCSRASPAFPAPPPPAAAPTREAILADTVQSWNAQEDLMVELRAAASAVVAAAASVGSLASSSAATAPRGSAAPAPPPVPAPALQTWSGPNIVVCVAGHDAFINICTPRRPGMLTRLLAVLEKHRVGVMTTTVSCDHVHTFFSLQARINTAIPPPPMLPENVSVEDRYKLAVSEMLHAVAN